MSFPCGKFDEPKEWRLQGSKVGLRQFSAAMRAYAGKPEDELMSEHEHFGPYMYLELGTSQHSYLVILQFKEQMKALALAAIQFYQRYISQYKGFCCAYAAYTSDASCSTLGYRAIRRFGVLDGLLVLNRRLARCGMASQITKVARPMPMLMRRQSGYIDCDGCDTPLGGSNWSCHEFLKILDCCSGCSCEWPTRGRATSGYREGTPDNEEALKRRSRLLREANAPTDNTEP